MISRHRFDQHSTSSSPSFDHLGSAPRRMVSRNGSHRDPLLAFFRLSMIVQADRARRDFTQAASTRGSIMATLIV